MSASVTVARKTGKGISATVNASASIGRKVGKGIAATVNASATVVRVRVEQFTGGVVASVQVARKVFKTISATVSSAGSIDKGASKDLSATVNASATVNRKTNKAFTATVNASATVGRVLAQILGGGVAVVATVRRAIKKSILATVGASGSVSDRNMAKQIDATIDTSGSIGRHIAKVIPVAVVNVSATVTRKLVKLIQATVTAAGTLYRETKKGIVGTVNAEGEISQRRIWKTIDAAVNHVVTVGRHITKVLPVAVVNVSGTVTRIAEKIAHGGVIVSATVGRVIKKTISAVVGVSAKVPRVAYDMAWEMNQTIRKILGKVQITYTDPFFSAGIVATATETGRFTYPAQTTDNVTEEQYKWFSLHRNVLDGTFHPLPSNQEHSVGWWSASVCSAAGAFWPYPVLTITHAKRTVESLLVVGDDKLNEYPTWFVVRLYQEGDVLVHTEAVNTGSAVTWTKEVGPFNDIVKQTLTIVKWSRGDSVSKISQFFTMLEETYEGEDGDLFGIRVLEEREFSQATIPQGNISANVLTVRLNNIDDLFSAGNFNSRLYGYLLNNRAIKAWLGCDLHSGVRHWFPLGTFYTRDWNAPEGEAYAEVTGYDMLDRLKQTTFSTSEVYEDITLYDLAVIVMADAGLTSADWDIDATLDTEAYTIPYAWFSPISHREALRQIAAACLGQCYCNRDGKIVLEVYVAPAAQPYDFEFGEHNYFDIDHPLEWSQMVNSVQARANPLVKSAEQDICVDTETFTVPAGETVTKTHFFDSAPCVEVVDPVVYVNPGGNVTLGARTDYAWGITQAYANATGGDETVTSVTIRGKVLEVQGSRIVTSEDADSISQNGRQTLSEPITSAFWQTSDQSQAVADSLLASYKDPRRDVVMKARGNIALLLGDRVVAPDYRDEVTMEYGLMRQDIDWDGGMEVQVTAQKIIGGAYVYKKHLEATVGVSGAVYENLEELRGAVVLSGTVGKAVKKSILATVGISGDISNDWRIKKSIAATVAASGSMTRRDFFPKHLVGTVSAEGSISRSFMIYAGADAANRGSNITSNITYISLYRPAGNSGNITEIDIYVDEIGTGAVGWEIGMFEHVTGDDYVCNDFITLGTLSLGLNHVTGLSLAASAGEYIGLYVPSGAGKISSGSGGSGILLKSGDHMDDGQQTYSLIPGIDMSLRGSIEGIE